jgi:hypothetical protein
MTADSGFRGPGGRPRLRGRAKECALLDDLLSAIGRGESRSLVLRGEAGIGKTALLEYLIASAPDAIVVRAVGVQSDMELAFASLHQVCGPLLDGEPPGASHGVDIDKDGTGLLREGRLYQLVREHGAVRERTLQITFAEAGAEAYAFTFG